MKHELATEALRATPAVAGTAYAALTLNEVVAVVTLCYIVVQVVYLLRKWYREEKDWGKGK